MIQFREELRVATPQDAARDHGATPATDETITEFTITEKLAATITNGMQQMSGFSPDIEILNVFKQLESINGKADS